jgi:hypothetical protein
MTPAQESEQSKLDEVLELTRENNRILRKMNRQMFWSQVLTYVYWFIILGLAGWSYYYFQPYVKRYVGTYQTIVENLEMIDRQSKDLPGDIQSILEKVR